MQKEMRRAAVLSVLLLVPAAVGAVVASARPAASGWTTHRVGPARIAIDAPATWIDMTRLTPQVLARVKKMPALASYITAVQQSKAIKLMLADAGPDTAATGFATNCNVIQIATIGDLRLLRDANLAQLKASGFVVGTVHAAYVSLPAGRAVEFAYKARYGAGTKTVSLLQFILARDGKSTVLTYTTLPSREAAELPVFLRSARSFHFV